MNTPANVGNDLNITHYEKSYFNSCIFRLDDVFSKISSGCTFENWN